MKIISSFQGILVALISVVSLALTMNSCATVGLGGGLRVGGSENGSVQTNATGRHTLRVTEAGPLVIDVIATQQGFDPMVELQDSSGSILGTDDDGGSNLNSRLRMNLQPGTYTIVVRGYGSSAGNYRVSVSRQSEGDVSPGQIEMRDKGRIRAGDTKTGSLAANEAHYYSMDIDSKKMILVEGNKTPDSTLDPYLVLSTENGTVIRQDDDGGGNLNSRIQTFINEGKYKVIIKGFSGSSGDYALSVRDIEITQLSLGQGLSGSVGPGEKKFYSLTVPQAGLYDIKSDRAENSALDPYLSIIGDTGQALYRDDDSGGELNAKITSYLPAGTFLILAEGSDMAGGEYRISADKSTVNPQPHSTIAPGETRNGWLIPEARHIYTMAVDSDSLVVLTNRRSDQSGLDPYLTLESESGELISRDDDSGSESSAMIISFLKKGNYRVISSPYGTTSGQYSLSAKRHESKAIVAGETKNSSVQPSDFDVYRFRVAKEGMFTVEMNRTGNSGIDPYLTLMGGDGKVITKDDDSGGNLNSRIVNYFNKGDYFIMASGLGTSSGAYSLLIRSMEAKAINPGETKTGTLSQGGQEYYSLTMKKSGLVTIDGEKAQGSNLDPYLILKSKNGMNIAQDDDGGGNLNSRISRFLSDGTYTVIITGYGGSGGAYNLRVTLNEEVQSVNRNIRLGQTVTGKLTHPEQRDRYSFSVTSYTGVVLRAKNTGGSTLDPFMELLDGTGAMIISDDDGGRDRNSVISRNLGPGQYTVVVRSYGSTTGEYLLSTMQTAEQRTIQKNQQDRQEYRDGPDDGQYQDGPDGEPQGQ